MYQNDACTLSVTQAHLSNEQKVFTENGITYMPVYYIMFFQHVSNVVEQFLD